MGFFESISPAAVVGYARMLVSRLRPGGPGDPGPGPDGARLSYSNDGRSGHVHYRSGSAQFTLYYEFGGGDCVAWIDVPPPVEWERRTGLPLARRDEVLDWIGRRVVQDQTVGGSGRFAIEGNALNVYGA